MSNEKFTHLCDLDGNLNKQNFNILTSKFGHGYEQSNLVRINNSKEVVVISENVKQRWDSTNQSFFLSSQRHWFISMEFCIGWRGGR